jgi:FkbM family methyltransferase
MENINTFNFENRNILLESIDGSYLNKFDELKFLLFFKNYFGNKNVNIIDCGSNIGSYSIFFSIFLNCNKIYSIEAIPSIFNILNKNIKNNNCKNIQTFNIGIGSKKGEIKLISKIPNNKGAFWFWYSDSKDDEIALQTPFNMGYKEHETCINSNVKINCDTLDNIVKCNDRIDFIKIDVEGMEIELLSGAKNIINKNKPLLYIEGSANTIEDIKIWSEKNKYNRVEMGMFKKHHFLLKYED